MYKEKMYPGGIKEQIDFLSNDTTCPMHIAAQLDQIMETEIVDAIMLPPVQVGDKAFFIINGKIFGATISFLYWQQNCHGISSEIRGSLYDYPASPSVAAPFHEWGKTVFATKEEAEATLRGMQHG